MRQWKGTETGDNMSETKYVQLLGTEQVQSAANTMREAAHEMQRAANNIAYALRQHSEVMREFMEKLTEGKS